MQRIASCSTGELTNRWTGATGSECRIKRDPAKVLGGAWPGQLRRYVALTYHAAAPHHRTDYISSAI